MQRKQAPRLNGTPNKKNNPQWGSTRRLKTSKKRKHLPKFDFGLVMNAEGGLAEASCMQTASLQTWSSKRKICFRSKMDTPEMAIGYTKMIIPFLLWRQLVRTLIMDCSNVCHNVEVYQLLRDMESSLLLLPSSSGRLFAEFSQLYALRVGEWSSQRNRPKIIWWSSEISPDHVISLQSDCQNSAQLSQWPFVIALHDYQWYMEAILDKQGARTKY